jgi:MFS family permease
MGLGSRWSGGLVEKTGPRAPLALGAALTAGGFAVLGFSSDLPSYWTGVLPGLLLAAIGMTLCVAPLTTAVFNAAPSDKSGAASGINNAAARVGGLLAIAALGLAFGGTEAGAIEGPVLAHAYRLVMLCAAVLAALSSLTAALTVAPETGEQRADTEGAPG